MTIYFWGPWREGGERLLWHPRGGYVRPEEALPPSLVRRLAAGVEEAVVWNVVWSEGRESWTLLPVRAGAHAGTFVASGNLSLEAIRAAARRSFRLLPDIEALTEEDPAQL